MYVAGIYIDRGVMALYSCTSPTGTLSHEQLLFLSFLISTFHLLVTLAVLHILLVSGWQSPKGEDTRPPRPHPKPVRFFVVFSHGDRSVFEARDLATPEPTNLGRS